LESASWRGSSPNATSSIPAHQRLKFHSQITYQFGHLFLRINSATSRLPVGLVICFLESRTRCHLRPLHGHFGFRLLLQGTLYSDSIFGISIFRHPVHIQEATPEARAIFDYYCPYWKLRDLRADSTTVRLVAITARTGAYVTVAGASYCTTFSPVVPLRKPGCHSP
jgi:hypothetical protein